MRRRTREEEEEEDSEEQKRQASPRAMPWDWQLLEQLVRGKSRRQEETPQVEAEARQAQQMEVATQEERLQSTDLRRACSEERRQAAKAVVLEEEATMAATHLCEATCARMASFCQSFIFSAHPAQACHRLRKTWAAQASQ
mmetsp:Transcript_64336/g.153441  ORF Transcript_64336/g.153441 Transcript_64336/m.153441 type:complete len:141 (+) Transcript_64336:237-659(+)